jgi:hypothetical protein
VSERIAHGNVQKSLLGAQRVIKGRPLAAGMCETVSLSGALAAVRGYDSFHGGKGHTDRRWEDTAVLRRKRGTTHLGVLGYRTARPAEPEMVAGLPRFASCALFSSEGLGRVALTELHNHYAGKAASNPDAKRIQETDQGNRELRRIWRLLEDLGFANVVVGDLNVPAGAETPGWLSTWEVFESLGWEVVQRHIDGAGISRQLELDDVEDIPKAELHSKHNGFVLTLSRKNLRRG